MNHLDEAKFWDRVRLDLATGCWEWTGGTCKGYGVLTSKPQRYAHRASYQLHRGRIPKGLVLDHLCRNTICVNPAHLEAVTQRENILRGTGFAARHAGKTHCPRGHEYTPENTYTRYDRKTPCRQCKACSREKKREAAAAKRAVELAA